MLELPTNEQQVEPSLPKLNRTAPHVQFPSASEVCEASVRQ